MENIEPVQEEEAEAVEPEPAEPQSAEPQSAEPVEEEVASMIEPTESVAPPAPKKRGRPPKAKAEPAPKAPKVAAPKVPKAAAPKVPKAPKVSKPKAAAPESDSSSSDVEETLRNVYNHVAKPDMETAILQMLVNRRQSEQQRRRDLWGQLARF